ncbi:MAG: signal recognition particle-docking protein FtsY [Halanaerobiales bacterium]
MLNFFKRKKKESNDKIEEKLDENIEEKNRELSEVKENTDNLLKDNKEESEESKEEYEENKEENNKEQEESNKTGLFSRLKNGLSKTRKGFISRISDLFSSYGSINDELFEELEEILIQADVGVKTAMDLVEDLEERVEEEDIKEAEELNEIFREELRELLKTENDSIKLKEGLNILMVVGVNGAGKTTTIAKIAQRFKNQDNHILLAAGDTFRAAAIDQLKVWGDRIGVNVIAQQEGSDSAAVAYDAVQAAKARQADLLIVDTAGRLHTQKNLMEELKKVKRVIDRESVGDNVEVLLVLDATTGQNAMNQAKLFNEAVQVDGIALTKLDGTAKGGIVIAIKNELGIPIKLIGVGEAAEDLQDFKADEFVDALFSE